MKKGILRRVSYGKVFCKQYLEREREREREREINKKEKIEWEKQRERERGGWEMCVHLHLVFTEYCVRHITIRINRHSFLNLLT